LSPRADTTLKLAAVFGVLGRVGFLAQVVIGVNSRIMPIFACILDNLHRDSCAPDPNPHSFIHRRTQTASLYSWSLGVPLLVAGVVFQNVFLLGSGPGLLFEASILPGINMLRVLRWAFGTFTPSTREPTGSWGISGQAPPQARAVGFPR